MAANANTLEQLERRALAADLRVTEAREERRVARLLFEAADLDAAAAWHRLQAAQLELEELRGQGERSQG